MNDTPKHITAKQIEIISSKPMKEKLLGLFKMTELSMAIIKNRFRERK
jgi:hypothetical protein